MLKAKYKHLLFILTSLTLLGMIGCSGPEEKKNVLINDAAELRASGQNEDALAILEELATEFPNDPEILRQIGHIFDEQGDATMAAFFLEQAHQLNPDDVELLYQTYLALEAADQPANGLLEQLSTKAPEAMSPDLWIRLGESRATENRTQPALDAYLKGVNPEEKKPSAETANAIGQLFIQVDNLAQAERWFKIAADNDSPDALTALFGLLEIKLRQEDWEASEAIIARLDTQFPGAIDASEWATARAELDGWRTAQKTMREEIALEEATKKEAAKVSNTASAVVTTKDKDDETTEAKSGKAQVVADLEAAESLANTPAVEAENTEADGSDKTITYDPSITIEPAEPDITFEVTFDEQGNSIPTTYTVENTANVELVETTLSETIESTNVDPIRPAAAPRSVDELIDEANAATLDKNYRLAISNYWQALGTANDRHDIWNMLSQVYLIDGQHKNAETTALESIRLSPREINYTLDYLRVAQRSKTPREFLAELETAYDRFPQSPEVTLSLARGYERIAKNNLSASTLYQRFIDLAPSHPLRPEAEAAINRL
ncbi:MAG: tetratricopeptide repeat protein [Opitutaceae bacterium]